MSHTPEPWAAYKDGKHEMNNEISFIKSLSGDLITYGHLSEEDARRIVACVNACSGMPTDQIEERGITSFAVSQIREISRLSEHLDEVLAALKAIVNLDDGDKPDLWHFESEIDAARAVIAKVEGN